MIKRILDSFCKKSNLEKAEFMLFVMEFIALVFCIVSVYTDYGIFDLDSVDKKVNVIMLMLFFIFSSILFERYGVMEKIIQSIKEVDLCKAKLKPKQETWELFFKDLYKDAKEIKAASLSNEGILEYKNYANITKAIINGTKFDFVSSNPCSKAVIEYSKYFTSDNKNGCASIARALQFYVDYLKNDNRYNANVKCGYVDWVFPYSLLIVIGKDNKVKILVDLYGIGIQDADRRSFIVEPDDYENIQFYINQFDNIKRMATPV